MSNCSVSSFVKLLNLFLPLDVQYAIEIIWIRVVVRSLVHQSFFHWNLYLHTLEERYILCHWQILFLLDMMLYWDIVVRSVCRLDVFSTGNALYLEAVDFFTWAHLFYLYWFGSFRHLLWATELILWSSISGWCKETWQCCLEVLSKESWFDSFSLGM